MLENPAAVKDKATKEAAFGALSNLVKFYNHANGTAVTADPCCSSSPSRRLC